MSISAKVITLGLTAAQKKLHSIATQFANPQRAFKVAGNAVANKVKSHLRARNQEPNKEGWAKSGFWAQIRDSVQVLDEGNGVIVQINDPRINLKYYGGTVTPKRGKALAIPLHEEYKGILPSTFPRDKFFFLPDKDGNNVGILAEALGDNKIRAAYLLRKSTTHQADPDALPPMADLMQEAVQAMERFFMRELAKQA
jgi:hypothetical protein